jgi:hypothetical protein
MLLPTSIVVEDDETHFKVMRAVKATMIYILLISDKAGTFFWVLFRRYKGHEKKGQLNFLSSCSTPGRDWRPITLPHSIGIG